MHIRGRVRVAFASAACSLACAMSKGRSPPPEGDIVTEPFFVAAHCEDHQAPLIAGLLTAAVRGEAHAWMGPDLTVSGVVTRARAWGDPIGGLKVDIDGYYAACDREGRVLTARRIPKGWHLPGELHEHPNPDDPGVLRPYVEAYGFAILEDLKRAAQAWSDYRPATPR